MNLRSFTIWTVSGVRRCRHRRTERLFATTEDEYAAYIDAARARSAEAERSQLAALLAFRCGVCGAAPGDRCVSKTGTTKVHPHDQHKYRHRAVELARQGFNAEEVLESERVAREAERLARETATPAQLEQMRIAAFLRKRQDDPEWINVLAGACPTCGAESGELCVTRSGNALMSADSQHVARPTAEEMEVEEQIIDEWDMAYHWGRF